MTLPHQAFAAEYVAIMAAPNGARRTRADHAALPVSSADLADCAARVADAGAAVLHLHVRDESGGHTLSVDRYRDALAAIRSAIGERLVLQVTTEAVGRYRADEQMNTVRELRPEAVSLALRELCPDEAAESEAARFFGWLLRERIWPQYILYDADDLLRFDALRRRGLFAEERPHCLLVLGRYAAGEDGEPSELERLLGAVDCSEFPWSVCCFGRQEHAAALVALESRGHVRLGFENNLRLADGSRARDNAALIDQFVAATAATPRRPACADDLRELLLSRQALA